MLMLRQAISFSRFVRFTPFDTSDANGRANERYRRIALTTITQVAAKGINILTALVSVPLALGYLGAERYGIWLTISSFIVILRFADLGLGNGLLNVIAEAQGQQDREVTKSYVSTSFYLLLGIALLLALLFTILYPIVNWASIFNVSSAQARREAETAIIAFVVCFLLGLPLGITQRIHLGYQEGFVNSTWLAAGNIIGLCGVLFAIRIEAGLSWLVLALAGGPVLALLCNSIVLFGVRRPWLRPQWQFIRKETLTRLLQLGGSFFVLQVAGALAFSSDNIVTAQVLGAEAVSEYAVPLRLFMTISIIVSMALQPFWPAYGEAVARQDLHWVRRTLIRSLIASVVVSGIPAIFLVVIGRPFILWWTTGEIRTSLALLVGLAIWTVLSATGNALAMFLNGANFIRFQAICAVLMMVAAVGAKIFLAQRVGVIGIVWGTIIAYVLFTVLPMSLYVPRLLKAMNKEGTLKQSTLQEDYHEM